MANTQAAKRIEPGPMPSMLASVTGRIMDVDSHEDIPTPSWVDHFGPMAQKLQDAYLKTGMRQNIVVGADDTEVNWQNVWNVKGPRAPGAIDVRRRIDVMDLTGTHRQLMFAGAYGLLAAYLYCRADHPEQLRGQALGTIPGDLKEYGVASMAAYNEWCVRKTLENDRVRAVGILLSDTPEGYLKEAKSLIGRGLRALMINCGQPLGGVSPAHPVHDPLWKYFADSNVPALLHIAGEGGFFGSDQWREAPAFEGFKAGNEFNLDPWTTSTFHIPAQNFITTMVLGGVFERHPNLRFGCIEVGAQWIGPLAENMDIWHANSHKFDQQGEGKVLPMKPSEYVRRNVRVSAFDIEPVDKYIRDFGLEETYCYASDYPHFEGGRSPLSDFGNRIATLGPDMVEKFFVTNGAWLLPD